jgi:hypothetical protein
VQQCRCAHVSCDRATLVANGDFTELTIQHAKFERADADARHGFVWHLILFKGYYEALAMYRHDVIIPFGLLSMSIQALLFAWIYDEFFARRALGAGARGLAYAAFGALLSWSFTTIAVAAKNVMSSVPDYLVIESAFTAVQWAIVGPLTALMAARPALERAGRAGSSA